MRILLVFLLLTTAACGAEPTYWAHLDQNGVVDRVIVADEAFIKSGKAGAPESWMLTDRAKNFAGPGMPYDKTAGKFIPIKVYPSWELDPGTSVWKNPVPMPATGLWHWDETQKKWIAGGFK